MQITERTDPSEYYRGQGVKWFLSRRTAQREGAFFSRHLRPGMRVLDCGCGPASITVGLAEAVAPGETVGIDLAPVQIEHGRELARDRGLANLRFEVGDVTALPFTDAEFDAVFASNVLEYLPDPLVGLRELRRVLRSGGLVGVLDSDVSTLRVAPESAFTRDYLQLFLAFRKHGASPFFAPRLGSLLRQAGFERCQVVAFAECLTPPDETRALAEVMVEILAIPSLVTFANEHGLADRAKLDELTAAARAWGDDPDAFSVALQFGATGWVA
jgi:ubiquinone/menaquinone biosynthesis C-methylase UbiE